MKSSASSASLDSERLPPIKRKPGRSGTDRRGFGTGDETGSQRSQNSARQDYEGFSLIKYIYARIAAPDANKDAKLVDFLKHTVQYLDRKRLNEREEVFGYTSLSLASSVGHVKVVNILMDSRADLELKCNLGNTALHMAARAGHTSVVRALLVHRAALESKNAEGWTPLIWGSMNGHEEVVAALLNAKSQVQAIDAQGLSALMWATRHGHVSVMKSILATGPDLSLRDFAGHTVMHHARQHRAARKMLQQFEELNRQLLNSAKSGDIGQASMALQAGAYVDALDHQGSSPLLLAASQRDFTMVKLLTRHGADLSLEASRTTRLGCETLSIAPTSRRC